MAYQVETVITITNFWGNKQIPAVFLGDDKVLMGRYSVWIPDGYDNNSGCGYSSRKKNEIYNFAFTTDVEEDVLQKRATRKQEELQN
jgi:hypothetical protein